ncbi:MAG: Rrf2 family transcriptional regulator [Planctomycetes bacterium]|nr:Rrf2 family transcriptional regulator [Planctomycetota bacterium]
MLRFSKKADYAILLLSHLARQQIGRAVSEEPAPQSAQDLASETGLSPSLTANILKDFARNGILASVRGAGGGYRLERDPQSLSLREILEVVDGPVGLVDCSETAHGGIEDDANATGPGCCYVDSCPSRRPLLALQERISDMLDTIPLYDLVVHRHTASCSTHSSGLAAGTSGSLPHNV